MTTYLRKQKIKDHTYYSLVEVKKDDAGRRRQRTVANYGRTAPIYYRPRVLHGDCLKKLALISPGSIQLCLTDPPYFLETKYGTGEDWDEFKSKVIFREFTEAWMAKVDRVLAVGGVFISFFCSYKITYLYDFLTTKGYKCLGTFTWRKTNGQCYNAKKRMRDNTETAIVMAKPGKHYTYNSEGKAIENILTLPTLHKSVRDKNGWHPTEKPVQLMTHLLRLYSNQDDVVLDPFGGKGSTTIACMELNRKAITIETDDYYLNCIHQRIANWRLTNEHRRVHDWKVRGFLCD